MAVAVILDRMPGGHAGTHQRRMAPERLGRRDVLDAVTFPEPVRTAKRRQAALGRNACASQDDDVADYHHSPLAIESE